MTTAGPGVREIRVRNDAGAFRVLYVASIGDAVYVLHAFQKDAADGETRLGASRIAVQANLAET